MPGLRARYSRRTRRPWADPSHHHDSAEQAPMSAQEAFEAARLLAEAYSSTAPTATRFRDNNRTGPAHPGGRRASRPARTAAHVAESHRPRLPRSRVLDRSLPVGAALSLVLWSLSSVNATTLAIAAAAPAGLAGAVGITARMIGRAVRDGASALPDTTVHQHHGPTYVHHTHQELHTDTRWFGRTINQLPGDQS
ncbi:hypothetical protein NLX86_33215 [Streptomyces sp. A3M-1-3]|uniref:hypothetical protein n=1 Tax=Streptomyces sp. A3M-1-3 TaxID=2962044 RepID=UPI0020B872E8|nr:hypothetical protein [Streptomyces sp. A3M-1-3]MCP3822767.1 hypothetical protein [Streptomyces sp. A3M-1-3]